MRLKIALAYVGTAYHGWQIQEKPSPPPTIQAELEKALAVLTGVFVRAIGAGRTDSGVHAHGQVAHCDVPDACRPADWRNTLNALLPRDIRVLSAFPCAPSFHARKDAIDKTYVYRFWPETGFTPPALDPFTWSCGPLDVRAMLACLRHLVGTHDFRSLQNAGTEMKTTVRTIHAAELTQEPQQPFYPRHAPELRLTIRANGFLKQMVRNIAGLLVATGRGKLRAGDVPAILQARSRAACPGSTAPARGLALARVTYAAQ